MMKKIMVLSCLLAAGALGAQTYELSVDPDKPDAIYQRGEKIVFSIRVLKDGQPADDVQLVVSALVDGQPDRQETITPKEGKAAVTVSGDIPGWALIEVGVQEAAPPSKRTSKPPALVSGRGGAMIDPAAIRTGTPKPADFDKFWKQQLDDLARIPINPKLEDVTLTSEESKNGGIRCREFTLDCVPPRPAKGYLSMPAKAEKGSLPIVVTLQGASSRSASKALAYAEKAISICPNPHGIPNGKDRAFYKNLDKGLLENYRHQGSDNRDDIYFKAMILRDLRAIQFAKSLPEWNGRDLLIHGSSQGGGRAMFAGALDPDVTLVSSTVPALTDHGGAFLGRRNGWPQFFKVGPDRHPLDEKNAAIAAVAPYVDTVNFAGRIKAEVFLSAGFLDTTCPPSCAYALYHALPAGIKKVMTPYPKAGHNAGNSAGMSRMNEILGMTK